MAYEKSELTSTGIKYKRDVSYFFNYDGKPNSTTLVDSCKDIEIDGPAITKAGWIDYLNAKYTKEIIDSNGADKYGSLGCEMEWDYSHKIGICLSQRGEVVEIQVNVRRQ